MTFEHWLVVGGQWELHELGFASRRFSFGEDWRANMWIIWPLVRDTYEAGRRRWMDAMLEAEPGVGYQPNWRTLTLTVAHATGLMRAVRRTTERIIVPDLRDLLGADSME